MMKKLAVGIISECRSFRMALATILTCEGQEQVEKVYEWMAEDLNADQKNNDSAPQIFIVDLDYAGLSTTKLLNLIRSKFRSAKLLLLLGERKFDISLIPEYSIEKILKRTSSETELIAAVQSCIS